jgi:hypothetical protein
MRSMPTVLLLLSFPAGALAYVLTVRVLDSLELAGDAHAMLTLFAPLFIAGLVMMPFLIPFLDRKAKEDLASIARNQPSGGEAGTDAPDPKDGD